LVHISRIEAMQNHGAITFLVTSIKDCCPLT
jgi:hypothetical protein